MVERNENVNTKIAKNTEMINHEVNFALMWAYFTDFAEREL